MGFTEKIEHKRVAFTGITMFQPNWFYHHEAMDAFRGQMVEVKFAENNFSSVSVRLPNDEVIEAKLTKITSKNGKTLNHTDSHLRKVIEIQRHALEQIEHDTNDDFITEIAREAIKQVDQIFMLHNQEIESSWRK